MFWDGLVILHPSLYRAVKIMFTTDIGGIVNDRQITSDICSGSLVQSFGAQAPVDFQLAIL